MNLQESCVLITGGTGSFGKTMVNRLLEQGCAEIRIFSRDEEKQDALRTSLQSDRLRFYIGDVRSRQSLDHAMPGVEHVFHAAALKQVPSCEFFPYEAVQTNVLGSENVIRAATAAGVSSVVCLSTDKAVFPVNAMGLSKALMEKVAKAAVHSLGQRSKTRIAVVRYGNVMYSRGSVIPLFVQQILQGKPITVTEPTMTRFLMPLRDSASLVEFAFAEASSGDIFIRKAPACTIGDLVRALTELFDVPNHPVQTIGWRHGEKLFETLASAEELARAEDLGDYWRIPMDGRDLNYGRFFSEGDLDRTAQEDFHSHNAERLDVEGVKALLLTLPEIRRDLGLSAHEPDHAVPIGAHHNGLAVGASRP